MAELQIGNLVGVPAVKDTNINGGVEDDFNGSGFTDNTFDSIDDMRGALNAIDANAYSFDNLDAMTVNDMIYAIRVHNHPSSIS